MYNNNYFFGTSASLSILKGRFRKFDFFSFCFPPVTAFSLIILLTILVNCPANAQQVTTYNADSSIIITKDAQLDELITKQKDQNLINQTINGFRIQIYFGVNRQKASEVKLDFASRYPDINAYLSYQQPNFKIRIGDFLNRYEAQKFLKEIDGLFPTSFIVPDNVKLPPLK